MEPTAAQEATAAAGGSAAVKPPAAARVSFWESLRGCGLFGPDVDVARLKKMVVMPRRVRVALSEAAKMKDVSAGVFVAGEVAVDEEEEGDVSPEAPMVVFVNSKSGGRHGLELMVWLQDILTEHQVFDLSKVKPSEFVSYGLTCIEGLAEQGDYKAKAVRERMRIMVAGGDGTVGWVLGCLSVLSKTHREPVPPTGIIPLGTGNDLSRTFGWGGSFPFAWRSAVKQTLYKATNARVCRLDSWQTVVVMPEGELTETDRPPALKKIDPVDQLPSNQEFDERKELPEKANCYEGVFYNYLSIGMDAQVAYGFHHLRNEKQYLARGPIANKLIYAGYSCTQGWFCTSCSANPQLRGLVNVTRLYIKKVNCSEWELVSIHPSVRSLVILNLYNYGSGRHPWGDLPPEYLEKRGFVEAHSDDGLVEIFGLKEGWHASFVLAELIKAKHIAQAAAVKIELRGGQWNRVYVQMDGEPWKQSLSEDFSTFIEIKREPHQSVMLNGQ